MQQHPVKSREPKISTSSFGVGRPKKNIEQAHRELIEARNSSVPELTRIERNYASIKYRRKRYLEEFSYERELKILQERNALLQKKYEKYAMHNETLRKMISYNISVT